MKISSSWLKDFIEIKQSNFELISLLESIGFMVESWEENDGDLIIDIETYANRPDTLGHLGIARELSVKLGQPLIERDWPTLEIAKKTSDLINIQIIDKNLCPRYCGLVVKDVQVGPSPDWLAQKIKSMGLNPINNIVDISNYVLFSTAQPIHIFDLDKIEGRKIIIRKAVKGELLKSLDEEEIELSSEMLVIADAEKPVALAGVIGGMNTAISDQTKDVFIESAYFDPVSIRKTSKKTGIQTDASYRFERGADISFQPAAAIMAASLLTQFGGKTTKGLIDEYLLPRKEKSIVLRHKQITQLLGIAIDESFITKTLSMLGCQTNQEQSKIWEVRVPSYRIDLEREVDLIEEIARFFGYDNIPATLPPILNFDASPDPVREQLNEMNQILFHAGFNEVVNFSFIDPEKENLLNSGLDPIEIRNPFSSKASLLRTTLFGGLLENIAWNRNRNLDGVHIFESGKIYSRQNENLVEEQSLALASNGFLGEEYWQGKREKTDFFLLKGVCESLMKGLGYESFSFQSMDSSFFEEQQALLLSCKGNKIGHLGLIKKKILSAYSIKDPVWAAELNLDVLLSKKMKKSSYSPASRFPGVNRDFSFIVSDEIQYGEIKKAIEKLTIPHLESFYLLNRFSEKPIPEGKVSLSFRFIFRHPGRTLLAEEVDSSQRQIISSLKTSFDFKLREGE